MIFTLRPTSLMISPVLVALVRRLYHIKSKPLYEPIGYCGTPRKLVAPKTIPVHCATRCEVQRFFFGLQPRTYHMLPGPLRSLTARSQICHSDSRSLPVSAFSHGIAADPALFRSRFVSRLALLAKHLRAALILSTTMI